MALVPLLQSRNASSPTPPTHLPFHIHLRFKIFVQLVGRKSITPPNMVLQSPQTSRRRALQTIAIAIATITTTTAPASQVAKAEIDFRLMTTPDQTLEEAEDGIKIHARSLLQVKDLLSEVETLREAQKTLRRSSSYLKQDIYTIINSKPGNERTLLRKLYSNLFNSVTRLDYAARDKDLVLVNECYGNVVVALNSIMSKL